MTIERCMNELKISNPLIVVENGLDALEYLEDRDKRRPGIIILDINMPKMNGHEFLAELKGNTQLRRIPVVVMTTSEDEQDKRRSFDLGASGYMIKPVDYKKFIEVIRAINMYWTLSEISDDGE